LDVFCSGAINSSGVAIIASSAVRERVVDCWPLGAVKPHLQVFVRPEGRAKEPRCSAGMFQLHNDFGFEPVEL